MEPKLIPISNEQNTWGVVFTNPLTPLEYYLIGEVQQTSRGYKWLYQGKSKQVKGRAKTIALALAAILARHRQDGPPFCSYRGLVHGSKYTVGQVQATCLSEAVRLLYLKVDQLGSRVLKDFWQQGFEVEVWNKKKRQWEFVYKRNGNRALAVKGKEGG
jgi:hypothetical protein